MSELFDALHQLLIDVESGRITAKDARGLILRQWGGEMHYLNRRDPEMRKMVRAMVTSGMGERTAQRKVRGK